MNNKSLKGKYGSLIILKNGAREYKFRAPTCKEYIQYMHIRTIDSQAADMYLLEECNLNDVSIDNIPIAIINKVLEYFIKIYNTLSVEEYKKAKLNGANNELLKLIYLISIKYNVTPLFLLESPISQVIEHILILEELTGIPFYSDDIDKQEDEVDKSKIHEAFKKAYENINKLKNNG